MVVKQFLAWLLLEPGEKIIQIRSWWPSWGDYGLEWPGMLVDKKGYRRQYCVPVWNGDRLRDILGRLKSGH